MNQSWQVFSPSAFEALDFLPSLGGLLFDGLAKPLVKRFAVHVRPSNSDQDLDGVLHKERVRKGSPLFVDSQLKKRDREDDLDDHFAEQRQKTQELKGTNAPPTFSSLPIELLDLIFNELNIDDILSLSLIDQYSWSVGRRHIQDFLMSFLAPWAGESIICVGDRLLAGDYPPGIFAGDREEESQRVFGRYGEGGFELVNFRNLPKNVYKRVECEVQLPDIFSHVVCSKKYQYYDMPKSLQYQVRNVLSPGLSQFYPEDQPWVLRNLTTKGYVRSEAIALKPEYIHGPDIDVLGFGEVILSRVCWSSRRSTSTLYEGGLDRGVWAGHRFDITTLARHEEDTKGEAGWEDISKEVADEIADIWGCEYGSDWRQIIVQLQRGFRWGSIILPT
ncbi:hypothetical protein FGG08_005561 [Glutinoglossum americanum]|uniref:F-box domain-containing protein n=1 Tax=Glutinoglossum americanum TaxID=1670608 RepID=A0A9P8L1Q0_9PEZI|nr:hypothetical protein FGG08_005561 [Glutinoglossum americanum]